MKRLWPVFLAAACLGPVSSRGQGAEGAAAGINRLGLELYQRQALRAPGANVLLSPYSIATALAMTYPGARGATRAELQSALMLPADADEAGASYQGLARLLTEPAGRGSGLEDLFMLRGEGDLPVILDVANRICVSGRLPIEPAFVRAVKDRFGSGVETVDFGSPDRIRDSVNSWVARRTHGRIRGLIPPGMPSAGTRMLLVNAIYMKARWERPFPTRETREDRFLVRGATPAPVQMMRNSGEFGYDKRAGYAVVTLPYAGGRLQFVLLLPNRPDGLAALEERLDAGVLAGCRGLPRREVALSLPRFTMAPETLMLAADLKTMGLGSAFDSPTGSADFAGIAPRSPDGYLVLGEVMHKAWIAVDEFSTEAAASTAVSTVKLAYEEPVVVRADHPFLFMVQHVATGACIFIGRVNDPAQ